jgi:hypothetical protein
MSLVTQRISFNGGASQQPDTLKLANQVKDAVNCYPDVTFGTIKRSGSQFVDELKNASDVVYAPGTFDGGKWFSIFRTNEEKYLGCIDGGQVYVWNLDTGAPQTVNSIGGAASYLTGTQSKDYQVLSVNDFTFITNRTVTVTAQATPAAPINNRAFIKINALIYNSTYNVVINGVTYTYTSPANATAGVLTATTVASNIAALINGIGGYAATPVGNGVNVARATAFSISVSGGDTEDALTVFQQNVSNISLLPLQCVHDYTVKVSNYSRADEDDYFVRFVADNGVSGAGVWQETRSPAVSPGLDATTMPIELVSMGGGVFELRRVAWEDRLVGDDDTNPHPSFVGKKINALFFFRNRFGALSGNNIIMSQAGDFFNFYANTALSITDSDPIDESVPTTRPVELFSAIPVAQGFVAFASGEQFLVSSASDALTPASIRIRTVARYEYDVTNDPADLGTTVGFISKSAAYTRVFEMETLGNEENPLMNDLSKLVPEWIPSNVDSVIGSAQNSLMSLASSQSDTVYLFSFYTEGTNRLNRAWFRWRMQGEVQHQAIYNDVYWAVTKQQRSYVLQKINLIQSPASSTLLTTDGLRVDPRLDFWATNVTGTYLPLTDQTKIYLPYLHDDALQPCVVTGNSNVSTPDYDNAGVIYYPEAQQDGGGWFVLIDNQDLSTRNLIVGYTYKYQIDLPELYYRVGEGQNITDFSAHLTIARIQFTLGLTSDVEFHVTPKGEDEYIFVGGVRRPNEYILDDISFVNSINFTVPVYQKSNQYNLSVVSESPMPVSLIGAMWEGRYNPRTYTRR